MVLIGWLALVVSLLIQGYGLYTPTTPGPDGIPGLDKLGHAVAFGVPAALAWLLRARVLVPVMVLHALVSEPLQQAVAASRQLDPLDAAADLVGIGVGVWVAATILRRWGDDGGMPSTSTSAQER